MRVSLIREKKRTFFPFYLFLLVRRGIFFSCVRGPDKCVRTSLLIDDILLLIDFEILNFRRRRWRWRRWLRMARRTILDDRRRKSHQRPRALLIRMEQQQQHRCCRKAEVMREKPCHRKSNK